MLARNAFQSLAPLAAFVFAFDGDPLANLLLGGSVFLALIGATAALRYWFFGYCITETSILIRDGIFNKRQLDISYARIQAINTQQNILYKQLGLVTVTFDTAGSSAAEGYLPAVKSELVAALERRIRQQPAVLPVPHESESASAPPERRELLRLTAGDIVLNGLSSGRVFLLFALAGPIGEYVDTHFKESIEESAVIEALTAANASPGSGILVALVVIAAIVLLLFGISIVGSFLRYHGFAVTAGDERLRSTGGLLTRHEHSITKAKVQSVVIIQPAALRLFRRFRLRVRQISSGRAGSSRDFVVPICRRGDVPVLKREIFGEELADLSPDPFASGFSPVSPYYLRSRIVLFGVLPSIAALIGLWPVAGPKAFLALCWLVPSSIYFWLSWRRFGSSVLQNGFALRSGLIGYRVNVWLHRKVQRLTITQSPFQRRRKLASIRFHLASGSVSLPFVDNAMALQLQDYLLYRIESS
ncbi:MAG: PH domain-containing protein [Woeseia sp.]